MTCSLLTLSGALKLLGHTDAEHLPLEPVLGRELAKVMRVQRGGPRHVGQAQLPTHGVDLVMHTGGYARRCRSRR